MEDITNIFGQLKVCVCWRKHSFYTHQKTCDISSYTELSPTTIFFAKVKAGLTDIIIGGIFMNEPINQIVGVLNNTSHQMFQNRVSQGTLVDSQVNDQKTSHKYIIENNLIVYEKYDCHGKLISKVPWSPKPIDEKV